MKDLRQDEKYAKYMESVGWNVDLVAGVLVYSKKLPILGCITKIQRPEKTLNQDDLRNIVRRRKSFLVKIEPKNGNQFRYYEKLGYKESEPSLPSKTVELDLTLSENQLVKNLHYKTRYNLKKVKSQKLKVKSSLDIQQFADFWQKISLSWGMFLPHKKYITKLFDAFGKNVSIYLAYSKKDSVAGLLTASTKEKTYYMYAAAIPLGKKLFAPTLLTWEAILDAKRKGKKIFDFEGIYDERFPLAGWRGFTRFKKSFGGHEVTYPPAVRKYFLNI